MRQAYDQTQEVNPNMSQAEQEALVIQALNSAMGLDKEFYDEEKEVDISWSKNEKKEALAEMAIVLKIMETSLPCIEKAETISDMIKCAPTPAAD
ncbi:MAG: hypothetical protein LC437_07880 [Thiohalomonas sp.]|nr:hypothetical protein [Thiohalomonas sp.]